VRGKGVRQGDPLSPLLFNFATDALAKMINMARDNKMIKGLIPEYIENGVAILQYAGERERGQVCRCSCSRCLVNACLLARSSQQAV
jgi:hypothetical protein